MSECSASDAVKTTAGRVCRIIYPRAGVQQLCVMQLVPYTCVSFWTHHCHDNVFCHTEALASYCQRLGACLIRIWSGMCRRMFRPVFSHPQAGGVRKLAAYDSNFLVLPRPDIKSHSVFAPKRASAPQRQHPMRHRHRRRRPALQAIPEDMHSAASSPIRAQHGTTRAMRHDAHDGHGASSSDSAEPVASDADRAYQAPQLPALIHMKTTPFGESASHELERTQTKRGRAMVLPEVWNLSRPRHPERAALTSVRDASSGHLPTLDEVLPPDVVVKLAATDTAPRRQLRRGERKQAMRKSASYAGPYWGSASRKRRCSRLGTSMSGSALAGEPSSPLPQFVSRAARDVRGGFYMPDTVGGFLLRQHAHNSSSQKLAGSVSTGLDDRLLAHHGSDRRMTAPSAPSRTISHPVQRAASGELQPPARDQALRRSHSLSRNLRVNVGSERVRSSAAGD